MRSTSEIGLFRLLNETSSAANVRRIEAITGPEAVAYMRDHDRQLHDAAGVLRVPPERVADSVRALREQLRELERAAKAGANGSAGVDVDQLAAQAAETAGATILTAAVTVADGDALLKLADRLKAKLGDAAIVLGRAGDGRVDLIASVAPSLVGAGRQGGRDHQAGGGRGRRWRWRSRHDGARRRPRSRTARRRDQRRPAGDRVSAQRLTRGLCAALADGLPIGTPPSWLRSITVDASARARLRTRALRVCDQ